MPPFLRDGDTDYPVTAHDTECLRLVKDAQQAVGSLLRNGVGNVTPVIKLLEVLQSLENEHTYEL